MAAKLILVTKHIWVTSFASLSLSLSLSLPILPTFLAFLFVHCFCLLYYCSIHVVVSLLLWPVQKSNHSLSSLLSPSFSLSLSFVLLSFLVPVENKKLKARKKVEGARAVYLILLLFHLYPVELHGRVGVDSRAVGEKEKNSWRHRERSWRGKEKARNKLLQQERELSSHPTGYLPVESLTPLCHMISSVAIKIKSSKRRSQMERGHFG